MRKVLFVLLIATFALALYWSYIRFNKSEEATLHPIRSIPTEAAIIIEANGFSSFWNHFSETNIAWQALKTVPRYGELDSTLSRFNNSLETSPDLDDRLNKTPVCCAIFAQGEGLTDYLVVANLSEQNLMNDWNQLLTDMGYQASPSQQYKGVEISSWSDGNTKYYSTYANQLLHFSSSLSIIQSSVSKSSKTGKLNPHLEQVYQTASKGQRISIFIQPGRIAKLFDRDVNKTVANWFLEKGKLGNWTELDFASGANSFHLFGFTKTDSSSYLRGIESMTPQYNECLQGIPAFASTFKWWGYQSYPQFMNSTNLSDQEKNEVHTMSEVLDKDLVEHINDWVDNQFASFTTGNGIKSVVCRTNGSIDPNGRLIDYAESDSSMVTHLGVPIYSLHPNLTAGFMFKERASLNFCYTVGDYVYFSANLATAKRIISAVKNNRVLANDEHFMKYYADKFSERSNFIYFCNLPFEKNGILPFLSPEAVSTIKEYNSGYSGFNRLGWQISSNENEMVYHNISLNYSSGSDQLIANNDLWEVELDSTLSRHAQLLKNHRTGTEEVMVQDVENYIYLISSAGNTKWKKQVDGTIIGEAKQIDVYGNGKYQTLFNTRNKIYLLDINGNHVKGFPINLPAFATNSVSVFDYENNHNYRILVATEGGKVYNFNKEGKIVEGWEFKGAAAPVTADIIHYTIANKDYICFHDEEGNIYALDRRGRVRHTVGRKIPGGITSPELVMGRSIGTTKYVFQDSTNSIQSLTFDGNISTLKRDSTSISSFTAIDYEKDGFTNFMIGKGNTVEIFGPDMSLLKYVELPPAEHTCYININGANYFYQLTDGELTMFNDFGDVLSEFPQRSDFKPAISDMNKDGKMDVIMVSGSSVKAKILK